MKDLFAQPAHLSVTALSYGVLKPLDFSLSPGRMLGVIGANGAGKSTLLKLLYRLYKPITGVVSIDGDNLHKLSNREAAQRVAAVIQEQPTQFSLTVRDVLKLGLLPRQSILARLNIQQKHQLDSVIAEGFYRPSVQ